MQLDGLSRAEGIGLIQETTAARNLLGYGVDAIRASRFTDEAREPILTLLSIGVEKLLKMALGLRHLSEHHMWLPFEMQKSYGHDLVKMDTALRGVLHANLNEATNPGALRPMLDAVTQDPLWSPLLAALDRYGRSGRFFALDALAGRPQAEVSPADLWDEIESAALVNFERVRVARNLSHFDVVTESIRDLTAGSLEKYWDAMCMAGVQGLLGHRGKGWGSDIRRRRVV